MRKNPLLLLPVVGFVGMLISCAPPAGMSVKEMRVLTQSDGSVAKSMTLKMGIKERGTRLKAFPAQKITLGQSFRVVDQREFIYPSEYQFPGIGTDITSINPATPTNFKTVNTGIEANLKSERRGGLVVLQGTITVTDFQGFTKMGGEMGEPILDDNGRLLTENRVEMPRLATFTTPVQIAMKPGKSYPLEISHPGKGTTVVFSLTTAAP